MMVELFYIVTTIMHTYCIRALQDAGNGKNGYKDTVVR